MSNADGNCSLAGVTLLLCCMPWDMSPRKDLGNTNRAGNEAWNPIASTSCSLRETATCSHEACVWTMRLPERTETDCWETKMANHDCVPVMRYARSNHNHEVFVTVLINLEIICFVVDAFRSTFDKMVMLSNAKQLFEAICGQPSPWTPRIIKACASMTIFKTSLEC